MSHLRRASSSAFLLLIAASACASPAEGPARGEAESEFAMRTLLEMVASGNADDVAGLFHPDAVYDDFANQVEYQGLQEISGYLSQGTRWADGVNLSILSLHVARWGAVAEWVFSGIHARPMGSLVPLATGRDVVLNGVTLIEVENGRIRRASDYTNALPMVLQLGAEVRMPGGGVLKLDPAAEPPGEPEGDGR